VLEELVDVGDVGVGLDDVGQRGPGGLERRLDVLAHLAKLGPHVAPAHHVALRIARELARHEDRPPALDHHHVGVEHVAPDDSFAERGGLDVLTFHEDV